MRRTPALTMLVFALLSALPAAASAECKRVASNSAAPGQAQDAGSPGSPGPIQGMTTLDCLKYVGSIQMGGTEQVLIQDDQGAIRHLKVGDPMGENGGVISRIDESTIYITQRVPRGKGKPKEVVVRFPKKAN